jgi:hypothetical protein
VLVASFHPELTPDHRLHELFLAHVHTNGDSNGDTNGDTNGDVHLHQHTA